MAYRMLSTLRAMQLMLTTAPGILVRLWSASCADTAGRQISSHTSRKAVQVESSVIER